MLETKVTEECIRDFLTSPLIFGDDKYFQFLGAEVAREGKIHTVGLDFIIVELERSGVLKYIPLRSISCVDLNKSKGIVIIYVNAISD